MQSYVAQVIFRIKCSSPDTEQYDEQWRLIFARDEREALDQALQVAREEEVTFVDRHGRTVAWQLVAVKDLQPLEMKQGSLLFSSVKEVEPIAAPVWAEA